MDKKVSIIIPVYNTEKYLRDCLNSVLNQTYNNLEIILINDGSTDSSLKICKEYSKKDNRIIVIDKKNTGVSNSRNRGIEISSGTYITFLDSDDYLEQDAIEIMVKTIQKENVNAVRTNFLIDGKKSKINSELLKKYTKSEFKELIYHILNADISAYMWLFLIEKEIIDKNYLRLNENLIMMEDTVFVVKLMTFINSIYLIDYGTCNYRIYESSSSNSLKRTFKNIQSVIEVNKEITSIVTEPNLIEIANRTEFRIIADYIIKLLDAELENDIKEIFDFLIGNTQFRKMISNLEYKKLSKYTKMIYKAFKNEKFNKIFLIYKKILFDKKIDKCNGVLKYKARRVYNKYIKRKNFV